MSQQVIDALSAITKLGSVDELWSLADEGFGFSAPPKVNCHFHLPPNFSAFTNVNQAIDLAVANNMGVLGANNYYDYEVYGAFATQAKKHGIFALFGMEIICMVDDFRKRGIKVNDPGNPGKFYLCGKGLSAFHAMTPTAKALLGKIRAADSARGSKMVDQIEAVFKSKGLPTGLTADRVIDMVVRRHGCPRHTVYLQERHIAQAFQEASLETIPAAERLARLSDIFGTPTKAKSPDDFVTIQNDLRSALMKAGKPGYVEETFISFDEAYQLIHALGGFASYPMLADGSGTFCEFETPLGAFVENLKSRQIHAAEFIPNRNSPAVMLEYTRALRSAGLIVTAGTEHNSLDMIPLEPVCKDGSEIVPELRAVFWEGVCVIAAHQFLTLHGQVGYVDGVGNLNHTFKNHEKRITELAKLGAAVIRKYQEAAKNNKTSN